MTQTTEINCYHQISRSEPQHRTLEPKKSILKTPGTKEKEQAKAANTKQKLNKHIIQTGYQARQKRREQIIQTTAQSSKPENSRVINKIKNHRVIKKIVQMIWKEPMESKLQNQRNLQDSNPTIQNDSSFDVKSATGQTRQSLQQTYRKLIMHSHTCKEELQDSGQMSSSTILKATPHQLKTDQRSPIPGPSSKPWLIRNLENKNKAEKQNMQLKDLNKEVTASGTTLHHFNTWPPYPQSMNQP